MKNLYERVSCTRRLELPEALVVFGDLRGQALQDALWRVLEIYGFDRNRPIERMTEDFRRLVVFEQIIEPVLPVELVEVIPDDAREIEAVVLSPVQISEGETGAVGRGLLDYARDHFGLPSRASGGGGLGAPDYSPTPTVYPEERGRAHPDL